MEGRWMLREDTGNLIYDLPDWVKNTLYGCSYQLDQQLYPLYQEWLIASYT